ncbi:MAG: endo-1,4-beta-xylanase [Oscillospiraceae bacterium]|nr:endo-1,4-beta-xylanase [Oscillospiraceae bacterium]
MNMKKLTAALTALTCCAGMLGTLPGLEFGSVQTYAAEAVYNDFEVNYDGWHGSTQTVQLTAENGAGFGGTRGMTVTNRTSASEGASSSKGFYLAGGVDYTYGVKVMSETEETFHLHLLYIDMETEEQTVVELDSVQAAAGEWVTLTADYEAPENTYEFELTITTDSTNDFSFDEVKITTEEAKALNTVYAASSNMGLKDAFGQYFRVGNILNGGTVKNSTITASMIKDYNSIECENETKPDATLVKSQCSGTNIGVSLNNASAIMDFCVRNGIGMRGHAFVWHSQTPSWFFKENFDANGAWVSKDTMTARLDSYIKNMFAAIQTQYPDLDLYAYDVVNEAVSDDSNRTANFGGARVAGDNNVTGGTSAWVSVYGDNSFVETAFRIADKYAPESCKLFYNDYNEYWDHKRDCIYNMCKSLYEKGYLDGIGMQSHINANYDGFSGVASYTTALKKYASIGCEVQITELDITRENGTYSDQQQADKYKAIFQAAIDINEGNYPGKVTAVCIWGPNDANTWIKTENAPLLYDTNHQPKTAYNTLMSMIPESEWVEGGYDGGEIAAPKPNEFGWYFHDEFEGDTCTWDGRGAATIMTSGRTAYVGSEALLVQNREAAWNGAYRTLNPRAFVPGEEFSFSANVMYFDGEETDTFYMKLQYVDAAGETQYSTIDEATTVKGEWVQLANTNYKIPADATQMQLYIETADSTSNFYIDEAIGAVGGTGILGAEQPELPVLSSGVKGDVDNDGVITAFDIAAAKKGLLKGFASDAAKKAADVDESGTAEVVDLVQLTGFVMGRIDKFTVVEKPMASVDVAAMNSLFSSITPGTSIKKDGENNPLYTQRFGADPGVMEYNGRVYVYMTNDIFEYDENGNLVDNTYGKINQINCISSDDMVNWTDHGIINVAGANGAAKWASNSWAPCAAHKTINGKEKFFLYFCNGGNGVSVLTADSPTGPWTDPLGHGLITRSTPNCANVTWLFDPAVFVDDDGTGYLYFGGGVPTGKDADPGTARVVKLGDDMISLAGDPQTINPPYLFEDSGINKIGNKYYYTYCSNWNTTGNSYGLTSGAIEYMVSDSPMGPFTYGGELFRNQGVFFGYYGNNHHSITELNGQLYLFYHSRPVAGSMGIDYNYRSPQVDKITMNGEKMGSVTGTMEGIAQLKKLSPYEKVQAETMSHQAGINVSGLGDTVVTDVNAGDWVKVSGVNFSSGCDSLTVRASSNAGAAIKVCTGSAKGTAVAYVEVPAGGMTEITVPVISSLSGSQDLYFVFSGQLEFDWWQFS